MNIEELKKSIEEDLKIDHASIKMETEKQALVYFKWASMLAESRHKANESRAKLTFIEACLSSEVRENPEKYSLKDKPTETAIKHVVVQNKDYIQERQRLSVLVLKEELLYSSIKALDYKNGALEYLNHETIKENGHETK